MANENPMNLIEENVTNDQQPELFTKNLVASALKSTGVSSCAVGCFRSPKKLDLIVGRSTRLELFEVEENFLKANREIPMFGRVVLLLSFRFPEELLDNVLVVTTKFSRLQLSVLGFDSAGVAQRRVSDDLSEKCGRMSSGGVLGCIHSSGLIALHLYEGRIKIIQVQQDKQSIKSFNVSCRSESLIDLIFFEGTDNLSIAYSGKSTNDLSIESIDLAKEQLFPLGLQRELACSEASFLISVLPPFGGVLAIGSKVICYLKEDYCLTAAMPPNKYLGGHTIHCFCKYGGSGLRFLLGDSSGFLYMLLLKKNENNQISQLEVKFLGVVSIPECLAYLGNQIVYVGSRFGDSQLLKIEKQSSQSVMFRLYVLESYCNIGPIRDLVIIKNDQIHQLVTCSGAFKESSLRVIRSGIGIDTVASVDLRSVRGIFTLRIGQTAFDNYLILSFYETTRLLLIDGAEMEDTQIDGFHFDQPTLWSGNMCFGGIVQVIPYSVQWISYNVDNSDTRIVSWQSPVKISSCSINSSSGQIVLVSGAELLFILIGQNTNKIQLTGRLVCKEQVACIELLPSYNGVSSKFLAVGFWTNSLKIYSLSGKIEPLSAEESSTDILPRSLLAAVMESQLYLFVGTGNGSVCYFVVDAATGDLKGKRVVTVGSEPILLRKFFHKSSVKIYVCCDRPAVVYSSMGRLVFASVNLETVRCFSQLESVYYRNSFVMADDSRLFIGSMENIYKLHIRRIPVGGNVSRVAYQPETNSLVILKSKYKQSDEQEYSEEVYSICLLNADSLEVQFTFDLEESEVGLSLFSIAFDEISAPFYFVGTGMLGQGSEKGRLIALRAIKNSQLLELVFSHEVSGHVYSIDSFNNKLICGIGNSLQLFEFDMTHNQLQQKCSHHGFSKVLYVRAHANLVLAGDLMRSVSLFSYDDVTSTFKNEGRSHGAGWVTSCGIIDNKTFVAAETSLNLFCYKKVSAPSGSLLKEIGGFFTGELVNAMRRGNLSENFTSPFSKFMNNPMLFGTADGGLGLIYQIPDTVHKFLLELQERIAAESVSFIGENHGVSLSIQSRTEESQAFVDGDLVETLLFMPVEIINRVVLNLKIPEMLKTQNKGNSTITNEVLKLVECISRIH